MTNQKIFNKVWKHFVTQRNPASVEGGVNEKGLASERCLYRGNNKSRCAFGLFIPNRLYRINLEGKSATSLLDRYPEIEEYFRDTYPEASSFWLSLQQCHDQAVMKTNSRCTPFTENITEELTKLASRHNLSVPTEK